MNASASQKNKKKNEKKIFLKEIFHKNEDRNIIKRKKKNSINWQ